VRSGAPVRIRGLAAVYIALAAFAIGCGGGGTAGGSDTSDEDAATTSAPQPRERLPETVQTLGIDATEYAFEIDPDELEGLEAGWTRLEFDNVGQEPHQVMFARIKDGVDMADIRARSIELSQRFIELVEAGTDKAVLASPRDPQARGSQVSFRFSEGYAAMQALIASNVVGDFRAPDIMRFGFCPLYNSVEEVEQAAGILCEIVETGAWDRPEFRKRQAVT